MGRIWAVARHMIADGIRMKIALIFIAIIIILLVALPLKVEGDGVTLKSRMQFFLAYTLGAVGFLCSLLTVFMSCKALDSEISQKQIFLVASKPIPRYHFFVGKWLGIVSLNGMLLILTWVSVLGFTWYLGGRPTTVDGDREALENEVLKVRHAVHMRPPDPEPAVKERMRQLREAGRLDDLDRAALSAKEVQLRRDVIKAYRSLGPGERRRYTFKRLLLDRTDGGFLQIEVKPVASTGGDDYAFRVAYQCGDPNDQERTMTLVGEQDLIVDRINTLWVPHSAVNDEGTLFVALGNMDVQHTMVFESDENFRLLFGIGTFHWNLFRALSIIWCRLAFLAAVGLTMSSFLSFPVACMVCFPPRLICAMLVH